MGYVKRCRKRPFSPWGCTTGIRLRSGDQRQVVEGLLDCAGRVLVGLAAAGISLSPQIAGLGSRAADCGFPKGNCY
jgi:hypothetical protein